MSYEFITYERKDRITYVTINRPERLNALHPPANAELHDAFNRFNDDPDAWVAILTGTGERAFSAGNDLRYTAERDQGQHGDQDPSVRYARVPFGGITSNFECWKPMIAAVNGYALGGGLETAMACDIIIAAEHAQLGLPRAACRSVRRRRRSVQASSPPSHEDSDGHDAHRAAHQRSGSTIESDW